MKELTELPLKKIVRTLQSGEISSVELTQSYIETIDRLEPKLKAFITYLPEKALNEAKKADRLLARWRNDPSNIHSALLGVPISIKDVLCVSGIRCTCGSRILENYIPPYNATAVDRLLKAGAIVIGKTNTDEFAMGSSTENSAYMTTHNPWELSRVPGGSSGGSAVSVSARMSPIALGTDTGGSVRQPASFCGITGIKPTYGRVSRYGLIAYGSSLDVVGALGRSVEDVLYVYNLIAGRDLKDATTADEATPDIKLSLRSSQPLRDLCVGIPDEYFAQGIQSEVEMSVKSAVSTLETLGARVEQIKLPHTEYAVPVYYIIAPAEASANLARFDGVRYGARVEAESVIDLLRITRGEKFGSEVKRRIMLGTYALSAGYYDAYYNQAQKVRTLIKLDFESAFTKVDIIAAPVAPTTAFLIGEHSNEPLAMYLEDIFTLPANLAGLPGLAFPVGFDNLGLPIGMQLMAPPFQEEVLFKAAYAYQQSTGWHTKIPTGI